MAVLSNTETTLTVPGNWAYYGRFGAQLLFHGICVGLWFAGPGCGRLDGWRRNWIWLASARGADGDGAGAGDTGDGSDYDMGAYELAAGADAGVAVFEDAALEEAILDALGQNEGPIYTDDLLDLTELTLEDAEVYGLTGLDRCVHLETLDLRRERDYGYFVPAPSRLPRGPGT